MISIHALRGEGDQVSRRRGGKTKYFNPRPPWGGRHIPDGPEGIILEFQSTPSVGRATTRGKSLNSFCRISIHALRGEGDPMKPEMALKMPVFQSTPSVGRATAISWSGGTVTKVISIHALRGEGDPQGRRLQSRKNGHFNPRPPWGGRRCADKTTINSHHDFNPRPPWGGRLLQVSKKKG